MVKAGIYLLARFTPLLGNHEFWNTTLIIIGGITMLYAAFHSIFRTDLKEILAYSTISALGILVFLLGIGTAYALEAAMVFILVHALYKATLFLVTGIIDHETKSRNVAILSGLRKVLFPVAIAGLLAALSNAGLPPFFGFIGKDLIYESTLHSDYFPWVLSILAVLTNVFLLYAGFQAGIKPFIGKLPEQFAKVHMPSPLLWIPPLLLAVSGLLFGILPALIDGTIVKPAAFSLLKVEIDAPIKLWHGFNTILLLSGITLLIGFLLFILLKPSEKRPNLFDEPAQFAAACPFTTPRAKA
jgi:multicomponent Na+:H+ antiporter subunit A